MKVKYLVKDTNATSYVVNNSGQTPLHYAVANASEEMAVLLTIAGCDIRHKDDGGNAPLFMAKTKKMEQVLRKAEKKCKHPPKPLLPACKQPKAAVKAVVVEDARKNSLVGAASLLVRPDGADAKDSLKGVKWNTVRGLTDAVDCVYIYIAGTGKLALPVPVKRTTSADDVINTCCTKLMLTEVQRHLVLMAFPPQGQGQKMEVPGFKPVLTVKSSYPHHKLVLYPGQGAPKNVGVRLKALADAAGDSA